MLVNVISSISESKNVENLILPKIFSDDIAYLQLTSGTTSISKAVVVTHKNLLSNANAIMGFHDNGLNMDPAVDKGVTWLPLYHDMGLIGFVVCTIYWGITTIFIPPRRFLRKPSSWMETIHKHRATISYAPNFAFMLMTRLIKQKQLEEWDLSCIKALGCGAEPINADTLNAFIEKFSSYTGMSKNAVKPSYGMAENTLSATLTPLDEGLRVSIVDSELFENKGLVKNPSGPFTKRLKHVSCGKAINGHRIIIVDDSDNIIEEGREGNIHVQGSSVTFGYYRDIKSTKVAFIEDKLVTGDRGYLIDGYLYVTGRSKELIIYNGRNIAPHEIEYLITKINGVRIGSVIAFSIDGEDTEKVCVLIGNKTRNLDEQSELKKIIQSRVYNEMSISLKDIVFVSPSEIPKTTSGKLKRGAARNTYIEGLISETV